MAAFDAHKNFAYSLVATAPSPASSGTSLVVTAGQGSGFPAVPFNAVVCPAGSLPTAANAEILRVTNIATDTLTIARAQEGSSARTIVVGDQIFAAATAKTFTDIEALIAGRSAVSTTGNITALALPAGSGPLVIYLTNATLSTIQGIAPGLDGQQLTLVSTGAGQVDLAHNDGAGTALGKLRCFITSFKTSLAPGVGTAVLEYDLTNTRWQLVKHEQGAAIDYTASSTIVGWSSFTSGRKFIKYYVVGRNVYVQIHLEGTSNSTSSTFTLPFTSDGSGSYPAYYSVLGFPYDNGTYVTATAAQMSFPVASSTVSMFKDVSATLWTASGTKITSGPLWFVAT